MALKLMGKKRGMMQLFDEKGNADGMHSDSSRAKCHHPS